MKFLIILSIIAVVIALLLVIGILSIKLFDAAINVNFLKDQLRAKEDFAHKQSLLIKDMFNFYLPQSDKLLFLEEIKRKDKDGE
ncbi:hypothetical protein [Alishewanella phage vB_AspM_Slickus01]|nr:hypothetical protein [Alishewanella phage vB_AspM_Slickus01]